uniref:Non-haem dioxygenase N-terminal domain-containing protein n=1 Tax=Oryza barthii TaxID=65489 RepID=A0A0D3FMN1_9ORYZ
MPSGYDDDRLRELKAFDDTKAGVKGLVDAGVTAVPRIFHHPPDPTPVASAADAADADAIPVIDLARADADRDRVVAQVRSAAESVGFFQVVNHGVPARLTDGMLAAVRRFNERPAAAKAAFYTRDAPRRRVRFNSNFDLLDQGLTLPGKPRPSPREALVRCGGGESPHVRRRLLGSSDNVRAPQRRLHL